MDLTGLRNRVLKRAQALNLGINVDDVDDELNLVQRQYIQPLARISEVALYTTTSNEVIDQDDIAKNIYRFNFVSRVLPNQEREEIIPLVSDYGTKDYGVRYHAGKVYLQGIPQGTSLKFNYFKKLKGLGTGQDETTVPDIDEQWHDLYVMGAIAMIDLNSYGLFKQQLESFKLERIDETRHGTSNIRIKGWW